MTMVSQNVIERYFQICNENLKENTRVLALLKKYGIFENYIFENFCIGYSNGAITDLIGGNEKLKEKLTEIGIIKKGKEIFKSCVTVPIYDENKILVNIIGYYIYPKSKNKLIALNDSGIFNQSFLRNMREIIFTENPLEALLLIQNDYPNTTFLFGDDHKYLKFINEHKVKRIIFTFEGKMRLFYELSKNGVSTKRVFIDFHKIKNAGAKEYFEKIFSGKGRGENTQSSDLIQEIENGFLFQLPHLNYRIIGNFSESTMNMKANIKVYNQNDVFVDYAESETMPNKEALNPIWK